jgi:hypothetical protein
MAAPAATHSIGSTPISALRPKKLLEERTHDGHAGRSTDEHDAVDGRRCLAGVGKCLLHRAARPFDDWPHDPFEVRARQIKVEVAWLSTDRHQERQ